MEIQYKFIKPEEESGSNNRQEKPEMLLWMLEIKHHGHYELYLGKEGTRRILGGLGEGVEFCLDLKRGYYTGPSGATGASETYVFLREILFADKVWVWSPAERLNSKEIKKR